MNFFHDLNKRLADLATKQDAQQLAEHAVPVAQSNSKLAQALNERDMGKHNNATTGFAALAKKAGKEYGSKAAGERVAGAVKAKMAKAGQLEEGHCSACDCSPCECDTMEESALQAAFGEKKYGDKGMKALQKAGREHASDKTMSNIRKRYDKYDESQGMAEGDMEEGAGVMHFKAQQAKAAGDKTFKMGDKTFPVQEGHCSACDCSPCECNNHMSSDINRISELAGLGKGMSEAKVDSRAKLGALFDEIAGYDDEGFEMLDRGCPVWSQMFDQTGGDVDKILATATPKKLAIMIQELEAVVDGLNGGMFEDQSGSGIQAKYLGGEEFQVLVNGETYRLTANALEGELQPWVKDATDAYDRWGDIPPDKMHMWYFILASWKIINVNTRKRPNKKMESAIVNYIDQNHGDDLMKVEQYHDKGGDDVREGMNKGQGMMEDLQADDGEHYDSFDDFVGKFDADSFDDVEEHSAGREIRGYINGKCVMSWEYDDESKTSGYGNYDGTVLEAEQIDEIGDTPKGQAALRAVDDRGTTAMDTWNKKPESGYTKAPKQTTKQFVGAMNADRRLHGFGPDASAKGRVQRQIDYAKSMQAREQGMTEGTGGRYADELAQQVFANNPNLDASGPARELLNAAYALAVQQLGRKRAQSFFDDEDFPSDFVTAYAWEQEQDDYYKLPGRDDLPEMVAEGWAEMNAWLDQREKEKGTGRFDKKKSPAGGTEYSRKPETFVDTNTGPEATDGAPKRRGRPAGAAKKPERVTAKSYKYKSGRPSKTAEDLDSDGVMMTRPSNMSSEGIEHGEQAEYNDEAGMAKDSLHTIVRSAKELERALRSNENLPEWVQEKIGQIKGMMSSVTDYILSTHEREGEQTTGEEGITMVPEKAPPGARAERMVKGIKKSLSKDGKLSDKDKAIAYATTWAAHNKGQVEEESTGKEDQRAERAGKRVAKDIEHDEGHRGQDDNRAERAGKKVTKDIEYDDAKDRKEKKSKTVKETDAAPKAAGKGAYKFGGGVYEGLNRAYQQQLNEGMSVNISMDEAGNKTVNVTATQEDAAALADLLNLAGMQQHTAASSSSCDQDLEENSPDWPTNTETLAADPELRTYSGGIDGLKSTGQSVQDGGSIPALRRSAMGENVELERSLFKLYQQFK
jgi:hypothetical protein